MKRIFSLKMKRITGSHTTLCNNVTVMIVVSGAEIWSWKALLVIGTMFSNFEY